MPGSRTAEPYATSTFSSFGNLHIILTEFPLWARHCLGLEMERIRYILIGKIDNKDKESRNKWDDANYY